MVPTCIQAFLTASAPGYDNCKTSVVFVCWNTHYCDARRPHQGAIVGQLGGQHGQQEAIEGVWLLLQSLRPCPHLPAPNEFKQSPPKFRVIIYSTSQASTNPSPTMHSPLKLSTWGRRHWRCSAQQNRLWWPAASTTRAASRHPLNHMTIICRVCHKSLCLRVEMYLQQYDGVCKLRQCCDGLLERCLVHIRQHVLPCNNTPV